MLVARVRVHGNMQTPGAEMRATAHARPVGHRARMTAALQGGAGIEVWNVPCATGARGGDKPFGHVVHDLCSLVDDSTAILQPGFSQPLPPFLLLARDFGFGHGPEVGGIRGLREMMSTQTHVKHGAPAGNLAVGACDDAAVGQELGLVHARHLRGDHVAEAFVAEEVAGSIARATVVGREIAHAAEAMQLRRSGGCNDCGCCLGGSAAACARCTSALAEVAHTPSLGVVATHRRSRCALVTRYEYFDSVYIPAVRLPTSVGESELFQQVILGIAAAAALEACTQE